MAGTATPMFLSTMFLLGRSRAAVNAVFADRAEACAWLASAVAPAGHAWSAGELGQFYRALESVAPRD